MLFVSGNLSVMLAINFCCFLVNGLSSYPYGSFATPSLVPMYLTYLPVLDLEGFLTCEHLTIIFAIRYTVPDFAVYEPV